jgi:hypothetical protein
MKKTILIATIFLVTASINAQSSSAKKDPKSEKKFTLGIGIGIGFLTEEPSVMNADIGLQGEYKAATSISLYGDLGYHRLFAVGEEGSFGYATLLAGPRGYLSPKFFIGVGAGLAFFAGEGESDAVFNFNPHFGYNGRKVQFTLGYNGLSDQGENIGFIQFRTVLKF